MKLTGRVSWFGGPKDEGVAPDEGLAFIYDIDDAPQLFLDEQPAGTTGLARRLNPDVSYIACRWDYDVTPRGMLLNNRALVRSQKTKREFYAYPADWGPHKDTGRIADISPGLMTRLGIVTDDEIVVTFPATEAEHMLAKAVVDISHWNGVTSFEDAKADGCLAVIHKVTESTNYVDPTYDKNKKAARAAGLLWGAYHFLRPGDMKAQAQYFVSKIAEPIDLYAADHEDAGVSVADLKTFCKEVTRLTGKKPIIYSGHVLKEQVGTRPDAELGQYRLWLAQYTSGTPSWPKQIWPEWWIWQYTETGDLAGITGDIDLNKYDGTAAELRAEWTGEAPAPEPEPEMQEVVITLSIDAPPNVRVTIRTEEA